jgi:predicted RNase H-like nuclease (RuvC/YqgF family)
LRLFSTALAQYAVRGHSMRDILKTVRTREEELDELRKQRKSVGNKAEASDKKLSRMSTENKNYAMQTEQLDRLTAEIRQLDAEILTQEAAISDFKRKSAREWMSLKFGGLVECTEKGTVRCPLIAISYPS